MHDADQPQGEFDGSGNASWNEANWSKYLKKNDQEVARFLTYYTEIKNLPDRLDVSARRMGWENADWGPGDNGDDDMDDDNESLDMPYCVHQHPVYIVSRALIIHLNRSLDILCQNAGANLTALEASRLGQTFADIHHQVLMAINATDTGDMHLALVHMKRSLSAINLAMGKVAEIPLAARLSSAESTSDMENTLFDLREICLRIMGDCRWDGSHN